MRTSTESSDGRMTPRADDALWCVALCSGRLSRVDGDLLTMPPPPCVCTKRG